MKVYAIFASTLHIKWIILEEGMCEKNYKICLFFYENNKSVNCANKVLILQRICMIKDLQILAISCKM